MTASEKRGVEKPVSENWLDRVVEEALAIYRETGDARAADYHIAFCALQRRLGREPSDGEILAEIRRM